jgi:hypothetical protein
MAKNKSAVNLAKLRAKKLSPEERSAIASSGAKARNASLTPAERSRMASKAGTAGAAARWGKKATAKKAPDTKEGK